MSGTIAPRAREIALTISEAIHTQTQYHFIQMDMLLCPKCAYDLRPQFEVEPVVRCPECGRSVRENDCQMPRVVSARLILYSSFVPLVGMLITIASISIWFGWSGHMFVVPYLLSLLAAILTALFAGIRGGFRIVRLCRYRVPRGELIGLAIGGFLGTLFSSAALNAVLAITVIGLLGRYSGTL